MLRELTAEEKLQALYDKSEIANVMGRYVYGHFSNEYDKVFELFAKRDDTTAEIANWGVYKGTEGIRRLYPEMHAKFLLGDGKGRLHANCITTPVIEVARDGKTAKGLWFITGAETSPKDEDTLDPHWTWARYAMDFIKMDGEWKIWHLHTVGLFHTPFSMSWVDYKEEHRTLDWIPDELKADEPTTFHWEYSTDDVCPTVPAPPVPYNTFDETFSYYDRYVKGTV